MASAVLFADPSRAAVQGMPTDNYIMLSWPPSARPNKYQIVANLGGAQTTIGEFVVPRRPFAGRIPDPVKARGPFNVADGDAAMAVHGSIALFSKASDSDAANYDAATLEMLGDGGARVSVVSKFKAGE